MSIIGYVRVSTKEQNEGRQLEIMKKYNVDKIFSEKISGKSTNRPQLQAMLEYIREGDTIVIESYSRLARNTKDLLFIVDQFNDKGISSFISDKEQVDLNTPQGKLMLGIFASLAQFERECLLQRQREGIEIAKQLGKYKGRKPISRPENFEKIYRSWKEGNMTAVKAMNELNLTKTTFYKMVKEYEAQ